MCLLASSSYNLGVKHAPILQDFIFHFCVAFCIYIPMSYSFFYASFAAVLKHQCFINSCYQHSSVSHGCLLILLLYTERFAFGNLYVKRTAFTKRKPNACQNVILSVFLQGINEDKTADSVSKVCLEVINNDKTSAVILNVISLFENREIFSFENISTMITRLFGYNFKMRCKTMAIITFLINYLYFTIPWSSKEN